jgi:A/G-specific adenine glycosylase
MDVAVFVKTVWNYYDAHGRHDLLWRQPAANGTFDPYKIMVSEIMLQQTQVARVTIKYQEFLQRFPTVSALTLAPLAQVLEAWSGLGYNRRAKFLWNAAQQIEHEYGGVFPKTTEELVNLPGVGKNTAGAIATYAFNRLEVFVETNIRTVFIHHFFAAQTDVSDAALVPYIQAALTYISADASRGPREWYWALMDYGTYLKQTVGNLNRNSKAYAKQSKFEGSKRQIRGHVLRALGANAQSGAELAAQISDERLLSVLTDLTHESMIFEHDGRYHLGSA